MSVEKTAKRQKGLISCLISKGLMGGLNKAWCEKLGAKRLMRKAW